MPLEEYRRKRKFTETPEPVGRVWRAGCRQIFVVQKHDASRLYYDFRLEINGVLVSWAVPKGPSANPGEKRLAIRTEDHPLEYADFEGAIPEGQYDAGRVMVWDKGTYQPEDGIPPDKQLARGKNTVVLHGKKLRGGFTLVQTGKCSAVPSQGKRWLLIKHRDEHVDASRDIESPEFDRSFLTGRTLQEIAEGRPGKPRIIRPRLDTWTGAALGRHDIRFPAVAHVSPSGVNPGTDGILMALEALSRQEAST